MSTGHVEYASLNGTHFFRIIGEVRAQSCISLDKLLGKIEKQSTDIASAVVDLTETTFIDSTVLGILAKLGIRLKQTHHIQSVMLSTNPDITTLANSMGLSQVFSILTCDESTHICCTQVLKDDDLTQKAMLNTVLDAHKTLSNLNKSNQNVFEPLVKQLEKQKKALKCTD